MTAAERELERLYHHRHSLDHAIWREETLLTLGLNKQLARVGVRQLRLPPPPARRTTPRGGGLSNALDGESGSGVIIRRNIGTILGIR